jgi:predicted metal-dependent hydrolase
VFIWNDYLLFRKLNNKFQITIESKKINRYNNDRLYVKGCPLLDIVIDKIIRSKRKSISLEITQDAKLIIRAPVFTTKSYIRKIVDNKADWIREKQRRAASLSSKYPAKSYIDGEEFWYLGGSYRLAFSADVKVPTAHGGALSLPESLRGAAQPAVTRWYREQALRVIASRVALYSRLTGLQYKSVGITGAQKRWGSCGANNTLNFSWRLVMAPVRVIDYVVVHELAHTRFHDHSKVFWQKVAEIMPDYEVPKQWLAGNSGLLK